MGEGMGVQGRWALASRTPSRGHTRTHRDTCPQESLSQTQSRGSYWGPARGPLCGAGTQSSPREKGVSADTAGRHREPPSVGLLGALPTPQLLDASPRPAPHMGLSEDGSQARWEDALLTKPFKDHFQKQHTE